MSIKTFKWPFEHSLQDILQSYNIDLNDFTVLQSQFNFSSWMHGILHTYRVTLHCLIIGYLEQKPRAGLLSALGAIIHDMARHNEGEDYEHGADAAKLKFDQLKKHIEKYTVTEEEQEWIKRAVTKHSYGEATKDDPAYDIVCMLKDADALDRLRFYDLNPKYLRTASSKTMIPFADHIANDVDYERNSSFNQFLTPILSSII